MDVSMADVNNWGWQGSARTIKERTTYLLDHSPIPFNITFKVGMTGEEPTDIQAHKDVLAIGSEVFYSMFYGLVATEDKTINIPDVNADAFRTMIGYLYTDTLHEEHLDVRSAFELMRCAGKYGVPYLYNLCRDWLLDNIVQSEDVEINALQCLQIAVRPEFEDRRILEELWYQVDIFTRAFLKTPDDVLGQTSHELMIELVSRDSLTVPKEKHLYDFVVRWANLQANGKGAVIPTVRERLGEVGKAVRYALMEPTELADGPAADGVLTADEGIAIYIYQFATVKPAVTFNTTPRKAIDAPTIICIQSFTPNSGCRDYLHNVQMARSVPAVIHGILRWISDTGNYGDKSKWGVVEGDKSTLYSLLVPVCGHGTYDCHFDVTEEQRDALAGQAEKSVRLGPSDVAVEVRIDGQQNRCHMLNLTFLFGGPSYQSYHNDKLDDAKPETSHAYLFYLGRFIQKDHPSFSAPSDLVQSLVPSTVDVTISLDASVTH